MSTNTPQPVIRVSDVAFPRFQAPDLDVMETFLNTFGMHRSARTETALFMRGTDGDHHVHVTHLGEPAFLGLAFNATHADLEVLSAATGHPIEPLNEPGGGSVVHLYDPDGRIVDVVADIATHDKLTAPTHPPLNTGEDRVRVNTLQRVPKGASHVKRFGHAALKTTSLATLRSWYADTLGLLVSDDIFIAEPDAPFGSFMRCDRGDLPADHHTLLLLETGEVRLGHCAWEVADFDDLMTGHEHLAADNRQQYWGVGRHVLGGQVFDYWKDPLGFTVEHWTDGDLLTANQPAGSHPIFESLNQWGPNPPADLDF